MSDQKVITVTEADLKRLIAEGIAAHQAGAVPAPLLDTDVLGETIGKAVAAGIAENSPRKKVSFGEYLAKPHSDIHPKGDRLSPKMARQYFQNGVLLQFATTTDREIELLNQLTHSGRYLNRLVEVIVSKDGADDVVHVRWNNSSANKRLEIKGVVRSFEDMLEQIVAAQKAERDEYEDANDQKKAPGRRPFGSGKAYQEAVARANG